MTFKPKGPLPFYLADFEKKTLGWSAEERWHYLRLLCFMWSNGGEVEDSDAIIAEAAGVNRARKWREKVEKLRLKLVSHPTRSDYLTQNRLLIDVEKMAEISHKRSNAAMQMHSKNHANAQQKHCSPTPTPISKKEEKKIYKRKDTSQGSGAPFDVWYAKYPRKVARAAALKAYLKSRESASESELLSAVERFAAEMSGKELEYIPHPATWLNGERWLDKPEDAETKRAREVWSTKPYKNYTDKRSWDEFLQAWKTGWRPSGFF